MPNIQLGKTPTAYSWLLETYPSGELKTLDSSLTDFNSFPIGIHFGTADISPMLNGPSDLKNWGYVLAFQGGVMKRQFVFAHDSNSIYTRAGSPSGWQPWQKVSLSSLGGVEDSVLIVFARCFYGTKHKCRQGRLSGHTSNNAGRHSVHDTYNKSLYQPECRPVFRLPNIYRLRHLLRSGLLREWLYGVVQKDTYRNGRVAEAGRKIAFRGPAYV